ncbi:MAG: hydrogenase expression/formation protein HypE [Deltaproteobacteria bacterium]|nr:hydrogenase expression/formation protein HypE [Deltaproteobacteria bacterium]
MTTAASGAHDEPCVELVHGSGGRATHRLVEELFLAAFGNPTLHARNDGAVLPPIPGRLVVSTDMHVVSPLFFPGGDIGSLAVNGTINDVAMTGARPLYLTAGFVLEAGLPLADLARIASSMATAAGAAGVTIVAGDTKVVEPGKADRLFISTTGVGVLADGVELGADRARPGDRLLLSGSLGEHATAILAGRMQLDLEARVVSDCAALHELVAALLAAAPHLRCLRDPTRGGLGATLNELAHQSRVGMVLDETAIPVTEEVRAICELLGFDPLYLANEGKLVAVCPPEEADAALASLRAHPLGRRAAAIGEVVPDPHGFVELRTAFGGRRVLDWLAGDQLPRIC